MRKTVLLSALILGLIVLIHSRLSYAQNYQTSQTLSNENFYISDDQSLLKAALQDLLIKRKKDLLPLVAIHTNSQTFTGQILQITENMVMMKATGTPDAVYNVLPMGVTDPVDTYHYIQLNTVEAFSVETLKTHSE